MNIQPNEWEKEFDDKFPPFTKEYPDALTVEQESDSKIRAKLKDFIRQQLQRVRLEAKKQAFARALYLVAEHDPQTGYDVNSIYWGQTLRKALIKEEMNPN